MNVQIPSRLPPHDPAALARVILAQPRFRMRVPASGHTWWDALRRWIGDRWNQLMDAFSRHVHVGGRWSVAAGDVVIAAIVALVILFAVRLLLSMARDAAAPGIHASALPIRADASKLHTASMQAAERGAYAVAVALLFRSALALLDRRGILRDDPARTVNECRSDVRARAAHLAAPFDRIARVFTAAVYAQDRMTSAHWSDALDAYAVIAAPQSDAA